MAKPLETLTESELKLEKEQLENAKSLSDNEKQRLKFVLDRLSALDEERSKTKDLANSLSKLLKLEESQSEILKSTVISFKEMGDSASNLYKTVLNLKNPSTIFLELLKLSVDRFIELDKAGQSFRETTGFLADQTSNVEITLRRTSRDLATFGVNIENSNAAAQKIAETFSSVSLVTDETVGHVALMEKNLGVSVDDSTAIMQNFMGIGQLSSTVANQTAAAAASLSKAAGVPFSKVMKDVAAAGGEAYKLIRGSVDALIKGAIEARRLGLELKDVAAAADKFLDFQTSINSEMEASVLFGRDINFTKARELSYAGDLAGLAKEQSRILKEVGGLRKLDAFQTKALAESMGLSVDQLIKMNAKQEELNQLRRDNPDLAAQYEKDLDVLNATNETLEQKAKREIQSRQIASQQQKIMNDIQQIFVELSEILLPIVKLLFAILVPILKIGAALVKLILTPIRLINDYFEDLFKNSEKFRGVINGIASGFQSLVNLLDTFEGKWVGGIVGSIVLINHIIKKELIQNMLSYFKLFKKIPTSVPTPTPSPVTGVSAQRAFRPGPLQIPSAATSISTPTPSPTPSSTPGATGGGGTSKFMEGIKGLDPKMLLSLGVAMIAFAGAVLILAHAAKVFGSPEAQAGFASMAIAAIGLAVITATLIGLSAGITTASPIILPAIGIMLAFAAAVGILSLAAMGFGKAFQMFIDGFERAIKINLFSLAAGFYTLSGAIATFGASMAVGGIGSLFGGGITSRLMELASISPALNSASMALSSIGSTLQMFKDAAVVDGIENITEAIKGLNKEINNVNLLNVAGLSLLGNNAKGAAGTAGGGGGDEVVAKLDELISLMKNGGLAVNLNGRAAGNIIASDIRFFGASGIS